MVPPIAGARHAIHRAAEPFLLLKENRFAHAAVSQLGERVQRTTRRLVFLSGPAGSGKSHLARQFVRGELTARPRVRIAHVTAAEFAAELAEAAEDDSIQRLQQRYRSLEVLVVEDLHSLAGRFEALNQLCLILDEVLAIGGRVLLSNRRAPGELPGSPPKLTNRCRWGVCASIGALGQTSRLSLIKHFSETRQIPIPSESAGLLARGLPVSARELLAALVQLDRKARCSGDGIDEAAVRRYLDQEATPREPTLAETNRVVARHFGVKAAVLRGHSRQQAYILPRQCAMYLARSLTQSSLSTIAEYFGRRHHSSVAYACQKIQQIIGEHPEISRHLTEIKTALCTFGEAECG